MWQNSAVKLFERTSILLGWETAPGMSNCSSLSQAELGTAETASDGAKITLQPQNCPGTTSVPVWGGREGWMEDPLAGGSNPFPQKCVELYSPEFIETVQTLLHSHFEKIFPVG